MFYLSEGAKVKKEKVVFLRVAAYIRYTFFDAYDFIGKTIIPFTVHGGSGLSGTVSRIQKMEPNATVYKNGLSIDRDNVGTSRKKIEKWLDGLK